MVHRMTLTIGLLGACVWCFILVSRVDSAQSGGRNASFKPVNSVHRLMEGQGFVFSQLKAALTDKQTEHRMELIEACAGILAELANVNTLNQDKADYQTWAAELRDVASELAEEADKKKDADEERMNALLNQMKSKCSACHDVYQ